jgi:hypothetical protein
VSVADKIERFAARLGTAAQKAQISVDRGACINSNNAATPEPAIAACTRLLEALARGEISGPEGDRRPPSGLCSLLLDQYLPSPRPSGGSLVIIGPGIGLPGPIAFLGGWSAAVARTAMGCDQVAVVPTNEST